MPRGRESASAVEDHVTVSTAELRVSMRVYVTRGGLAKLRRARRHTARRGRRRYADYAVQTSAARRAGKTRTMSV